MMIIMLLVLVIEKLVVLAIVLVVVLDIGSVGVDRVPTLLGVRWGTYLAWEGRFRVYFDSQSYNCWQSRSSGHHVDFVILSFLCGVADSIKPLLLLIPNPMMVSEALVDFLSGSAGGVANVVVGQPMDTVKVFHVMFGRESKIVRKRRLKWCVMSCHVSF